MSTLAITTPLPSFPRPFPARGPATSELLRAPWRWLRSGRQDDSRIAARLHQTAARGRPIVLGTAERPWTPPASEASPLATLRSFRGLEIRITTRSPVVLRDLELLTRLDRDHAVQVDVVVPGLGGRQARESLDLVRRLAGQGLPTCVVVPMSRLAEAGDDDLRRFVDAARRAGAFDVRPSRELADASWARRFERLRLQHGFPLPRPGRG